MIETLGVVLPIIIYLLLIVLLVVVIVLGIKIIITIDRVNAVITDIQEKINSLNNVFQLVDMASNKLGYFSSKLLDTVISAINKVLGVGRKDEDDDYE